jgi:hypothetical protein
VILKKGQNIKYLPYAFSVVFEAIRQLMAPPSKLKRKIGFDLKEKQARYGRKMSR